MRASSSSSGSSSVMVRSVWLTRPRRTMRSTSRSASAASSTLPDATQWSGVARPVQSPTAMRLGPSAWATASIESPSRMPRPVVSWVSRASRSSSGSEMPRRSSVFSARSARRMTTRPRRYLPVSPSCSTRPRFWRVASSREAVDLWRPSRRASSVTPASPWLSPRARSSAAARSTERTAFPSSTIAAPLSPRPGATSRPSGRPSPCRAPGLRAPRRASPRRSRRCGRPCRRPRAPRR